MFELTTEAIVLDKEDLRDYDQRIHLYTSDLGKVSAKTVSSRKILSKLAAHLEPLNLVTARFVSRGDGFDARGLQLVDALSIDSAPVLKSDFQELAGAIKICELVRQSIPSGIPDESLWDFFQTIRSGRMKLTLQDALKTIGFNSLFARCQICDKTQPEYFVPGDNFFACTACTFNADKFDIDFIKISV